MMAGQVSQNKMQEETKLPQVAGITVLKQKGSHARLEVDTGAVEIGDALRQINVENMEDINISNVPLENIIMEIYKAKDRQQAKSAVEPVG